jgi:cytidylate kinase
VVLPEADLKIYLDASAEERARRRFLELRARGEAADYSEILTAMKQRDAIDSTRAVAPLRRAEDAVMIDSDGRGIEEVLEIVKGLVGALAKASTLAKASVLDTASA